MTPHDDLSPQRLDELLDGRAGARSPDEEALVALVSELRASEGPSPDLRARVRAVVAPPSAGRISRLTRWVRGTSWTHRALALAPACVLVVGTVFAVSSLTDGGGGGDRLSAPGAVDERGAPQLAAPVESAPPASGAARDQAPLAQAALSLRVAGGEAIATAAGRTRDIAAANGGRTVRERYFRTARQPGRGVITLEVPSTRYEETRTALEGIGTIFRETTDYGEQDGRAASPVDPVRAEPAPAMATITVTLVAP
jgi:hypothetical protein